MDIFEKFNRRFGEWYESLFSGGEAQGIRPRDILRKLLDSLEELRETGIDGAEYVRNAYVVEVGVASDEERDFVQAFVTDKELKEVLEQRIRERGYKTKGPLLIEIRLVDPSTSGVEERDVVHIVARFDRNVPAPRVLDASVPDEAPTIPFRGPTQPLAALIVRSQGRDAETFPIDHAGVQIGRSKQRANGIVLADDDQVSREHLRIAYEFGSFVATDLNSVNGTRKNGKPLVSGQPQTLADGDILQVGRAEILFRLLGNGSAGPPASGASQSDTGARFHLLLPGGQQCAVASGVVIGSGAGADVRVDLPGVAERHARFVVSNGRGQMEDLASGTGTFIGEMRLPPHFPVTLYNGNRIMLGDCVLEFREHTASNVRPKG